MNRKIYRITETLVRNNSHEGYTRLESESRGYAEGIFPTKKDVVNEMRQEKRNGGYFHPYDAYEYTLDEVTIDEDGEEVGWECLKDISVLWQEALDFEEEEEEQE